MRLMQTRGGPLSSRRIRAIMTNHDVTSHRVFAGDIDSTTLAFSRKSHVQEAQHVDPGWLVGCWPSGWQARSRVGATRAADGPQVAHMVYFKLKDSSGANRAKLAAACKLFLTGHEGTVSFAVGTLAGDLNGPFNDHDFDVSLHLVFVNKAALDKYHAHPRHEKFLEENKETWEKGSRLRLVPLAGPPGHEPQRLTAK